MGPYDSRKLLDKEGPKSTDAGEKLHGGNGQPFSALEFFTGIYPF
jgi:hypothetical protein